MGEGTPGRRASAISCGLHRLAEALGDRAHDRVDYAQPEDEPGLRVLVRDEGGSDLLGDDPTDAQKARQCRLMRASQTPSNTSIHPSDPWPLAGHPEAMKKSYRRDYFHTSAWKGNSQKLDFRVIRYARMVLSTVSSGQGRPPCRCDEGCVAT